MNIRDPNYLKHNDSHSAQMDKYLNEGVAGLKPPQPLKAKLKYRSDLKIVEDNIELKFDANRDMYYRGESLPIKNNPYSFWIKTVAAVGIVCTIGFALYNAIKR